MGRLVPKSSRRYRGPWSDLGYPTSVTISKVWLRSTWVRGPVSDNGIRGHTGLYEVVTRLWVCESEVLMGTLGS